METDQSGNPWNAGVATEKKGQMKIQEMVQGLPTIEWVAGYI